MLNIGVVIGLIKKLAPVASPEVIAQAVNDYLDDHPEIEVADGSITEEKLAADVALTLSTLESDVSDVKSAIHGIEDAVSRNIEYTENLSGSYVSNKSINTNKGIGNVVDLTPSTSQQYGYFIASCREGNIFTIKGVGGNNVRGWAFLDSSNKLISISDAYALLDNIEITAPANAAKIVCNLDMSSSHKLYRKSSTFEIIDVETIDKQFVKADQMFDNKTITVGKKYANGVITDDSYYCLSDFIKIEASTNYTFLNVIGALVYFTAEKLFIYSSSVSLVGTWTTEQSPSNAGYIRLQMTKDCYPFSQVSMAKGDNHAVSVETGKHLKNTQIERKPYMFSATPIPTEYTAVGVKAVDGNTGTDFDDDNPSLSDLYDAYDALVEAYPNYITKQDLGTDQSGTYHLYAYYFTPEEPDVQNDYYRLPYPKINLLSGIHGNGTLGDSNINCFCLYYLMKSICENWRESDALAYMRWNVRFAILPVQNPWGFENKNRCNSRGVDLNKNFSAGWASGGSGTPEYSGTGPLSEAESIIINDFAEANNDAIFSTDMHSQGQVVTQTSMTYVGVYPTSPMWYVGRSLVTTMTKEWDNQNIPNLLEKDFHGIVHSSLTGGGTQQAHMWAVHGIPSMTMEGFKNFSNSSYSDNSQEIAQMVADQLGYYILLGLNYFKNK